MSTFTIESGVAIPARTIPNAGPRASKYPVDQLQEGQGFAVPLGTYDENDNFTAFAPGSDEAQKQARQKQSQFSGLAKTRGIKLVTRYFATQEDNPFTSVAAPCLGVWHGGPAEQKDGDNAKADDANADVAEKGNEASDASADDDIVVL